MHHGSATVDYSEEGQLEERGYAVDVEAVGWNKVLVILFGVMAAKDDHGSEPAQTVEVGGGMYFVGGERALVVRPQSVGDEARKEGVESHVESDEPSSTEAGDQWHAAGKCDREGRERMRTARMQRQHWICRLAKLG